MRFSYRRFKRNWKSDLCSSCKEGYYVLINYKSNQTEADKTLSSIKNKGNGELLQFDVSNKEEIKATLDKWIENNTDKIY